ncbi:hypothetical protein [Acetonema longum]|uniref:Condensation domain-containing protein n=1 Tax=Acetonema longum DSM 6540 TaxID=1009370 RepID=F7NDT8_9FIRM|nr:hypothetical protein [Acetonema longum]EGO65809.1 hypothetical protein ALO_00975 [Acetonema longum DSM 6540]
MKVVQLAGLYFLGTEEYNSSNNMMATVVFKEKIDGEKLFPSYRKLILQNPLLQTRIAERPEQNMFAWERFSPDEIEYFLRFEQEEFDRRYDKAAVLRQYYPTNSRLPFYITIVDDRTAVICMNHVLANGRSFIFWIERWLQYYAGGEAAGSVEPKAKAAFRQKLAGRLKRAKAFVWLPVFLVEYMCKAGKKAAHNTVDLSYGKQPGPNNSYALKAYSFSREDTQDILRLCKRNNTTLTEHMCSILAESFLQYSHQCGHDKKRVLISMPMDMQPIRPYTPENTYGNLIASLPAQFFGGKAMEPQIKAVFKWFRRGIPYSLSCLAAAAAFSYEKTKRQCLTLCQKTMPKRSPLGDFSLTYSNLGVITSPVMEKLVDAAYFYFKPQTILVVSSTLAGRLHIKVSLTKDLYDAEEVFALFDQMLSLESLLQAEQKSGEEQH